MKRSRHRHQSVTQTRSIQGNARNADVAVIEDDRKLSRFAKGFLFWGLSSLLGFNFIPSEWLPLFAHCCGFGLYLLIVTRQTRWLIGTIIGIACFLVVAWLVVPSAVIAEYARNIQWATHGAGYFAMFIAFIMTCYMINRYAVPENSAARQRIDDMVVQLKDIWHSIDRSSIDAWLTLDRSLLERLLTPDALADLMSLAEKFRRDEDLQQHQQQLTSSHADAQAHALTAPEHVPCCGNQQHQLHLTSTTIRPSSGIPLPPPPLPHKSLELFKAGEDLVGAKGQEDTTAEVTVCDVKPGSVTVADMLPPPLDRLQDGDGDEERADWKSRYCEAESGREVLRIRCDVLTEEKRLLTEQIDKLNASLEAAESEVAKLLTQQHDHLSRRNSERRNSEKEDPLASIELSPLSDQLPAVALSSTPTHVLQQQQKRKHKSTSNLASSASTLSPSLTPQTPQDHQLLVDMAVSTAKREAEEKSRAEKEVLLESLKILETSRARFEKMLKAEQKGRSKAEKEAETLRLEMERWRRKAESESERLLQQLIARSADLAAKSEDALSSRSKLEGVISELESTRAELGEAKAEVERWRQQSSEALIADLQNKVDMYVDRNIKLEEEASRQRARLEEDIVRQQTQLDHLLGRNVEALPLAELERIEAEQTKGLKSIRQWKERRRQEEFECIRFENERLKKLREDEESCRICCEREIKVVLLPCGHACVCRMCASNLEKCPICRSKITSAHEVYVA
mmetsp:Transcript_8637/g.14165  ORF Transcript_8637/g.14165 Transcript_8637/m.14165 type:complete len:741 (-) Transcript_8637:32-2254(-)